MGVAREVRQSNFAYTTRDYGDIAGAVHAALEVFIGTQAV